MSRQTQTIYTQTNENFGYGTAGGDAFLKEDVQELAQAVINHNHTQTRGAGVGRVQTATAPSALGDLTTNVRVNSDDWQWWAASAAAVYTAVNDTAAQTVAGNKNFTGTTTLAAVTLGGTLSRAADQTIDLTGAATRTLTVQNSTSSQVANVDVDGRYVFRNGTAFTMTLSGAPTAARVHTFPDVADDTVVLLAASQALTNKTLDASVGKGTWTASGTWTLPAHTLGGVVSGGGQQLNNVIIGTVTPLAGAFTTVSGTGYTFTTSVSSTTALATPSALSATQFTGFASTVSGASIMGYGTTNDVTLMNRAGTVVLGVTANTSNVTMAGALAITGALSGVTTGAFSGLITGANAVFTSGSSPSAGASRIGFYQQAPSTSTINCYGADASTNGGLAINSYRSDGSSGAQIFGVSSAGLGTFAGGLVLVGNINTTGARVTQSYHTNITSTNAVTVDSSILSKVPSSVKDYGGDALAILRNMRVVSYQHLKYLDPSRRTKLGIIAETVGEPLALQEIEDTKGGTYPGVNMMGLLALHVRALQQADARIAALEARLN